MNDFVKSNTSAEAAKDFYSSKEYFNSLSPEGKLVHIWKELGFENAELIWRRTFVSNPKMYEEAIKVASKWELK